MFPLWKRGREGWNELGKRVGCALTWGTGGRGLLKNTVTMLTFSQRWAVSGELWAVCVMFDEEVESEVGERTVISHTVISRRVSAQI